MAVTVLRTSGGILDDADRAAFTSFADRIGQGAPRVLVHLHGGLVDQSAAEAMAARLSAKGPDSYNAPDDWEQVYIVWRTGALETLRENWTDLARNDRLYRTLLKRLISFLSSRVRSEAFAGRSLGDVGGLTPAEVERRLDSGDDAPFADIDEAVAASPVGARSVSVDTDAELDLQSELENDTDLEDAAGNIEASLAFGRPGAARASPGGDPAAGTMSLKRLDASVQAELVTEVDEAAARSIIAGEVFRRIVKHGVAIGFRVLQRYRNGRHHGLHATVAEEIARELYGDLVGSIVWGVMKGDAGDHFGEHGFGLELAHALSANADARIMVVAHSAGSIFASDLLIWAGQHDLPLAIDLVFLAAAVRTLKFAQALELSESRIARFRSFLMRDDWERKDAVLGQGFGFVYPASLLYLVSGLFEEQAAEGLADAPILGMERFLLPGSGWLADAGEGAALARVHAYLSAQPGRTVLAKVADGEGLNCDAIDHGDFDNETATLASVRYFLGRPRS